MLFSSEKTSSISKQRKILFLATKNIRIRARQELQHGGKVFPLAF
jgi:hypothetical protein